MTVNKQPPLSVTLIRTQEQVVHRVNDDHATDIKVWQPREFAPPRCMQFDKFVARGLRLAVCVLLCKFHLLGMRSCGECYVQCTMNKGLVMNEEDLLRTTTPECLCSRLLCLPYPTSRTEERVAMGTKAA